MFGIYMRSVLRSFFLCLFIFTAGLPGTLQKVSGQWSFTPNYYQYDASIIGTNTVYRLLEDPFGFIWMVSDKGILVFNGKTYETIKIPGTEQEIVNIYRYKNTVFAGTYSGKLFEIDMLTFKVEEIPLPQYMNRQARHLSTINVMDDKLYLAKTMGPFVILDLKKKKTPTLISHSNYLFRYLLNGDTSIPDLRFHPFWFKLLDNKVFVESTIYDLQNRALKVFYTAGKDSQELKTVSSYLKEGSDLYVGFLQSGGLVKYNNYNVKSYQNIRQTILPDVEVGDILKDSRGNIWISTLHNGVFVFLRQISELQKLSSNYTLYNNDIWYIKYKNNILDIGYKKQLVDQLKDGAFYKKWIGDTTTIFNPVLLFRSYKDKFMILGSVSSYMTDTTNFNRKNIYKDFYTYNNELYGTMHGIAGKFLENLNYQPILSDTSELNFYTRFPLSDSSYVKGGANGLFINDKPTIVKDRVIKVRKYNNDIIACTDNGLYIKRKEKYFHITQKDGLPDNQCVQIEYPGNRYYQLLTKQGLSYIDTADCKIVGSFNAQSLGYDAIIHHFDIEKDTIWLATNKGIFIFDEKALLTKAKSNITAYLYPEQLTGRSQKYMYQNFELKYSKEKLVKMHIEVISFSPKEYYIAYQVAKENKIIAAPVQLVDRSFFVNTPEPGTYTIKLYIGSDKNHIDKQLTYLLKIMPLWYQTLWIKILLIFILIIAFWFIVRIAAQQIIKEKEKRLKEKYATLQLQSQAFFTQLNPHFIFNALTPLQSHILKNEKMESLEYLDRFSSLMRDILKNSDKTETDLKTELKFIKKYIDIQQTRFTPPFIFELNIDPGIDQDTTPIPAMLLQPIIENAIEHGIKNKGAEGLITVDIQTTTIKKQECLQIEIGDNGAGLTQNFLKEGHALYILQKRIQTLQKRAGTIASLTHRPGKNGVGTIFTLLLSKTKNLWMP